MNENRSLDRRNGIFPVIPNQPWRLTSNVHTRCVWWGRRQTSTRSHCVISQNIILNCNIIVQCTMRTTKTCHGYYKAHTSIVGLENREYGRRDLLYWPRNALYPQKLVLTSPTSGGRSVGIVRSWTKAMEFSFILQSFQKFSHVTRYEQTLTRNVLKAK
jgi:hypothetical protein